MSLQCKSSIVQLANGMLDRMIESHDPYYGLGTMTGSVYDTAWVSMIPKTDGNRTVWLFPQSFTYLLDRQQQNGGWQPIDSPIVSHIDWILNTAAALLSVCRHREAPYQLDVDQTNLDYRISLGKTFLKNTLDAWDITEARNVGFEILLPALLDYLAECGMDFDFPCRSSLYRIRNAKLSMLNLRSLEEDGASPHSILHSLEALKGRVDFDLISQHKVCGSIMASPSATAAYLIYAIEWDLESEAYLRHVLARGDGRGSGSVPSAFPTTVFEVAWVLSTLLAGGMCGEDLGSERTRVLLKWVHQEFQAQQGLLGFARQIQPDADDTAKGVTCLNNLGVPASSASLVKSFGQGEWFKTYSKERNASISTNCNAVIALLSDHRLVRTHSPVIARTIRHLCEQWFVTSTTIDKWNVAPFYTMMLLAQALAQTLKAHTYDKLSAEGGLYEEDVPLVLFQILIHVLQRQGPDGSWKGSKETTAYALITIDVFKDGGEAQLFGPEIHTAVNKGRAFLVDNYETTQPELLWIEKVAYRSTNVSEAYILAAMYCSSEARNTGKPTFVNPAWEKSIAMGKFYSKLPLLKDAPEWLIYACATEGSFLTARLRQKCTQILQDPAAHGKHIRFIPFTWTMVTRLTGVELAPEVQLDMMTFSALLYTLDHHMEMTIGARRKIERQAVRNAITEDFNHLEKKGHLPNCVAMDKTLEQIVTYVWKHHKVQNASTSYKHQLLVDLRLLLLSHLDQLDDNEDIRNTRKAGLIWQPNKSNRHSSLHRWIQSTSGHHTGGGAAFSFFLCLVSFTNDSVTALNLSPQANYLLAKLSESLRALSRLQNDWGSIERDKREGNLNSVDFLVSLPSDKVEINLYGCAKQRSCSLKDMNMVGTLSAELNRVKKILSALAEQEKKFINQILLQKQLETTIPPFLLDALRVFATAVEIYGQMYIMRDHTC